ncbi:cupin domain-containing protein [Celerinatantimonas sp. YJH-8]|uniref:cupin domain-containing protein n=1 Tax=Celerinatantimonas sp. YJH-8 TaxID=3228714 RepID=UPI0038BF717F
MHDVDIGARLRTLRKEAGLSQRELARRAGVTNGFISQVEKNQVSPSVASLKKLLTELPLSLAEFFAEQQSVAQQFYSRAEEHPDIGQGPISYRMVGAFRPYRNIGMLHEILKPGADSGEAMLSHAGEECAVVVRGCLELTVEEQSVMLYAGDSYYFDSLRPHRFRNISDENCELVSANAPPTF